MKKVILFLSIIGATLLMTSCLGDSETSYSGAPLSYIASESGVIYARTLDGLPITSPQIKMLNPGNFVFIAYSWRESENTTTADGIYNVTVSNITDPIEQTTLIPREAPEQTTELPLASFEQILYGGAYFGYHWICRYNYEKGDGNKKKLSFYHNISEGSENEVIIDVRLENATGTVDKDQQNVLVAANLKQIRDHYLPSGSGASKDLKVYFRYYRKKSDGTPELYKTPDSYRMIITNTTE